MLMFWPFLSYLRPVLIVDIICKCSLKKMKLQTKNKMQKEYDNSVRNISHSDII